MSEKGIINGISDKEFAPSDFLTREQAAKLLCVATGLDIMENKSEFKDVDGEEWYAGYVLTAQNAGIVNGISDSEFGIGLKITRQDFAVMIARAFGLSGYNDDTKFADSEIISDYAKQAVSALYEMGIVKGYPDNTFRPFGNCTRAEAAIILYGIIGGGTK